MRPILLAWLVAILSAGAFASEPIDLNKSKTVESGRWKYVYSISAKGSRSERRAGELSYAGGPIAGAVAGDRIDTPWGRMQLFDTRYNTGWLLRTTYDGRIDNTKGRLLPEPKAGAASRPAFGPSAKLADLADNTVMDLGPFRWERPAGERPVGSVTDYSGMTYDPHNHRILLFGGGHAATYTDAIYAFTFSDLSWHSLYTPTPAKFYKKDNMDRGFWKAGGEGKYPRPVGRHTYDLLAVPDDREELLMLMNGGGPSSVAPGFGYWGGAAGRYDFKTGRWTMLPKTPFGGYAGVAEYDPLLKKVVGTIGQTVDVYDPADGKSVRIARNISDRLKVRGYAGTMVYFPPDKRMYVIPANKKVWIIELDRKDLAKSRIIVPTVKGTCPAGECGFAYDAANHVIGGGVKDNRFYVFDPARMEWTSHDIRGGKPGTMTFHCLAHDPVNNVYVFIARRRTWVYRYKAAKAGEAKPTRPVTAGQR